MVFMCTLYTCFLILVFHTSFLLYYQQGIRTVMLSVAPACLCVCVCLSLSPVRALTVESLNLETLF